MAGDFTELRERLRREMADMSTFVLASHVRHARRQVNDHPNEPHHRVYMDEYAAELKRRHGIVITDPPLRAS